MKTMWLLWIAAIVLTFAGLEAYAILSGKPTLSEVAAAAGAAWPPLLVVYGIVFGGLAVHFWWHTSPPKD